MSLPLEAGPSLAFPGASWAFLVTRLEDNVLITEVDEDETVEATEAVPPNTAGTLDLVILLVAEDEVEELESRAENIKIFEVKDLNLRSK